MTIESPQPQPFSDAPLEAPGGCSRPFVVGCGVAVVLAGLLLLGVLWKAQDLMPALFRWSLEQFEQQIAGSLPEELGEAERQRLAAAFDAAAAAVADGSADPAALQRLQGRLMEVVRADPLTVEQVRQLTGALEALAGDGLAPAEPEPPPAVEPAIEGGEAAQPLTARRPPPRRGAPPARRLAA